MPRTTVVEKLYKMSAHLTKNQTKELMKALENLKKRRRKVSSKERALLEEAIRRARIQLLIKNRDDEFLEVSKLGKDVLSRLSK